MMLMYNIGKRLLNLRLEHDLSLRDLGSKIGVADSSLCRIENGKAQIGTITALKLAKFYDVSLDYLLGLSDIKNPRTDGNR